MNQRHRHGLLAAVLAVYGVALLLVAFWPVHVDRDMHGLIDKFVQWCANHSLPWVTYPVIEWSANVLWFVPLGVLLTVYWDSHRWWLAVLVGLAVSSTIELGQTLFLPGRTGSVLDVFANTLGTLMGALLAVALHALARAASSSAPSTAR